MTANAPEIGIELADVRAAFLRRPDIKKLPAAEKEARWEAAVPNILSFMGWVADRDPIRVEG
jgi:hypothetical protein